nr:unknown [Ipomoea trifida]
MCPPMKAPNVTAGFTWPPEMLAPTETATKSAIAWDSAAAISPEGVEAPPSGDGALSLNATCRCLVQLWKPAMISYSGDFNNSL